MLTFLLAALVLPADARISLLDGNSYQGVLAAISNTEVRLSENGTEQSLPLAEVLTIDFPGAVSPPSEEPQQILLRDGSILFATAVTRSAKAISFESTTLGRMEIDNSAVHSVRLKASDPALRDQWETFLKRDSEKDLLIVLKRDGSGLDFLPGIVSSLAVDKAEFLFDGDAVSVSAERIYGAVFAATKGTEAFRKPHMTITTRTGNLLAAKTVALDSNQIRIDASWGSTVMLPIEDIVKIDLSGGRIQYLSDLVALEERFDGADPENSLLAIIDKDTQKLLFGPRRDTTMERDVKMRLRGREFAKGLCLHSRTEITWALDSQFSTFECLAGVDDEVAWNGKYSVSLTIKGDDKVLFEKLIASSEDPISLQLPVEGVSTLSILVDFGDGESTCDWLDLADAKLILARDKSP
jgi:hypothetical protein